MGRQPLRQPHTRVGRTMPSPVKDLREQVCDAIDGLLNIGGPPIVAIDPPHLLDDLTHQTLAHYGLLLIGNPLTRSERTTQTPSPWTVRWRTSTVGS
jgi:hypothetical protein